MATVWVKGHHSSKLNSMNQPIDVKNTLEIIERMKFARIGEYRKWERIAKKIKNDQNLSASELEYFTTFTRIYKNLGASNRSKRNNFV